MYGLWGQNGPGIYWASVTCDRCNGSGGPLSHWDDEACHWEHYVCSSCSGQGQRMVLFATAAEAKAYAYGRVLA
jgi:DnaJ-class molecular chaperone